jgi:hypothetical protein
MLLKGYSFRQTNSYKQTRFLLLRSINIFSVPELFYFISYFNQIEKSTFSCCYMTRLSVFISEKKSK